MAAPATAVGVVPAIEVRVFRLRAGTDPVGAADLAATGSYLAGGADPATCAVQISVAIQLFAAATAAVVIAGAPLAAIEATPAETGTPPHRSSWHRSDNQDPPLHGR